MAHDFAKKWHPGQAGRRNTGAARRQPPSAGTHWSWYFAGLLSGLFVAFVGYLGILKPTPAEEVAAAGEEAAAVADATSTRGAFDFYQILPQAEVAVNVEPVVVEQPLATAFVPPPTNTPQPTVATQADSAQQQAAETRAAPAQVAVVQTTADEGDVQYLLQAGSFQAREDAETRRASLILLNMQANVVPGTVAGKVWHRVQVGPFNGRGAAETARATLTANGIDTIVLRMR